MYVHVRVCKYMSRGMKHCLTARRLRCPLLPAPAPSSSSLLYCPNIHHRQVRQLPAQCSLQPPHAQLHVGITHLEHEAAGGAVAAQHTPLRLARHIFERWLLRPLNVVVLGNLNARAGGKVPPGSHGRRALAALVVRHKHAIFLREGSTAMLGGRGGERVEAA